MAIQRDGDRIVLTADVSEAAKTPARLEGSLLSGHMAERYGSPVWLDAVVLFDEEVPVSHHLYFRDVPENLERLTVPGSRWMTWRNLDYLPPAARGSAEKEDKERWSEIGGYTYWSVNAILADWITRIRKAERKVYQDVAEEKLLGSIQYIEGPDGTEIPVLPKSSIPSPRSASLLLRGMVDPASLERLAAALGDGMGLGIDVLPNLVDGMPPVYLVDPTPMKVVIQSATRGDLELVSAEIGRIVDAFKTSITYLAADVAPPTVLDADPAPELPAADEEAVAAIFDLMIDAPELRDLRGQLRDVRDTLTTLIPNLPGQAVEVIASTFRGLVA